MGHEKHQTEAKRKQKEPPVIHTSKKLSSRGSASSTLHLSVSTSCLRGIISLKQPCSTFIGLRECVTALFAHALHLPHFSNRLLELLHSSRISAMFSAYPAGYVPRSVVLNVVLLYLLNVVVSLRVIHPLCVLPGEISNQTEARQDHRHSPKYWRRDQPRKNTKVFSREANHWSDGCIYRHEYHPDDHGTRDCHHGILGPQTVCAN
jgi:hypothetical protein